MHWFQGDRERKGEGEIFIPFQIAASMNWRKEEWLCHTEWDPGDGGIILMGTEEVGNGTSGGMADQFRRGDVQPRKRKSGFLKKKPISFGKTWVKLRKGSKN
jgi:hypothetical protein